MFWFIPPPPCGCVCCELHRAVDQLLIVLTVGGWFG